MKIITYYKISIALILIHTISTRSMNLQKTIPTSIIPYKPHSIIKHTSPKKNYLIIYPPEQTVQIGETVQKVPPIIQIIQNLNFKYPGNDKTFLTLIKKNGLFQNNSQSYQAYKKTTEKKMRNFIFLNSINDMNILIQLSSDTNTPFTLILLLASTIYDTKSYIEIFDITKILKNIGKIFLQEKKHYKNLNKENIYKYSSIKMISIFALFLYTSYLTQKNINKEIENDCTYDCDRYFNKTRCLLNVVESKAIYCINSEKSIINLNHEQETICNKQIPIDELIESFSIMRTLSKIFKTTLQEIIILNSFIKYNQLSQNKIAFSLITHQPSNKTFLEKRLAMVFQSYFHGKVKYNNITQKIFNTKENTKNWHYLFYQPIIKQEIQQIHYQIYNEKKEIIQSVIKFIRMQKIMELITNKNTTKLKKLNTHFC